MQRSVPECEGIDIQPVFHSGQFVFSDFIIKI